MGNERKWSSKSYQVNYNWDNLNWGKFFDSLNSQEHKNTRDVIDNELMSMDLLECLVDDSANQDAIRMLAAIGIRC